MRTQNIAGVRYTPWEVVGVVQPSVAVNRDSCMAKVVMQIMICVCKTSQTIKHAIYVVLPYSPHLRETVVITTSGELRYDPPTGMRGSYLLPGLERGFSEFLY
jgi:hypothetical protein